MSNEIAHKAVRNTFFNGASMAAPFLAGICKTVIVARALGPTRMGLFSYGVWLAGILGVLALRGLNPATAKYVAEFIAQGDKARAVAVVRHIVVLQLLTSLAVAVVVVGIAGMFVKGPSLGVVGIAALILIPDTSRQVLASVLAGWQRYDKLAYIGFVRAVPEVGLVALAAILRSGVLGMLAATLGCVLVNTWVTLRTVYPLLCSTDRLEISPRLQETLRRVHRFALSETYLILLDAVVWSSSEIFFLKRYCALSEVALFGIAYALSEKPLNAGGALLNTLIPLSSEAVGRAGVQAVGKIYESALKYAQVLMVPIFMVGIIISKPLIRLLYGPRYLSAAPVLQLLLVAVAFAPLAAVAAAVLSATERQGFIAKCQTPMALLNIVLDLALIPKAGSVGAAIAKCVTQAVMTVLLLIGAGRTVSGRFPAATTARIYLSGLVGAFPALLAYEAGASYALTGAAVIASAFVYLVMLVACGEIRQRELSVFYEAIGRPFGPWLGRGVGN